MVPHTVLQDQLSFVDQINDKILDIVDEIMENIQEERIFLFSDILDKKSKLRSYFEKQLFYCGEKLIFDHLFLSSTGGKSQIQMSKITTSRML